MSTGCLLLMSAHDAERIAIVRYGAGGGDEV